MARKNRSAGLSLGQVLTLTLGFLVASLLIFVFGIWVGKDLVERRLAQEERIVRKPAENTVPEGHASGVDVTAPEGAKVPAVVAQAAPAAAVAPSETPFMRLRATPTATPGKAAAAVPTKPTSAPAKPTAIPLQAKPDKPEKRSAEEWADAGWTVQVYATTDPNQATALARRLLAKGYDAYTLQAPMHGQTWYRVRVGRFTSRERALEMEQRLKKLEGQEAAYVTSQ